MAKMTIKGVEYEFADSVAPVVQSLLEDNQTLSAGVTDSKKELTKVQAQLDAAKEKMKEMEDEKEDEKDMAKKVEDAANERLAVLVSASKFIKDYDPSGKSLNEIKRDVLEDRGVDLKDKDDVYVDARWDILCEEGVNGQETMNDALRQSMNDDGKTFNDDVSKARAKKIERAQAAYKTGEKS